MAEPEDEGADEGGAITTGNSQRTLPHAHARTASAVGDGEANERGRRKPALMPTTTLWWHGSETG